MCNKPNCIHFDTSKKHKDKSPKNIIFTIITVSDTIKKTDDISGQTITNEIKKISDKKNLNYSVADYDIVKDNVEQLKEKINLFLQSDNDVIIFNGGTGISKTDVTIDAIKPYFEKELVGFNSLFNNLSYNEIGSAALLSRSCGGIIKSKAVFCIPGSPRACLLAMEKLILPEIGHIIGHIKI